MPTVFLIRHGESQSNAGLATPNPESVELTDRGWKQAKDISDYLEFAKLRPNLIVTSSYQRTKQTAAMTTLAFPDSPEEEWSVKEFTYLSSWLKENSTVEDRRPFADGYWQIADPTLVDGPGSESFAQFIDRVRDFKALLESTKHSTIAIFSHEQFISAFTWLLERGEVTPTSEEMSEYRSYLLDHPLPNGAIVHAKFYKSNGRVFFKKMLWRLYRIVHAEYHQGYGWSFERIIDHLSEVEERVPELALSKS
jgi:2,3-bisphosphoglycerate-dependent phosphoglycerate mutase